MKLLLLLLGCIALPLAASPLVIAHRGASGDYPEHTLQAYRAAIDMGADYIEPDLVVTADGHLIARHDTFLGTTTNVADVFPQRRRVVDGRDDWFVSDFTLAEIRQLKARQPFKGRSAEHDDQYPIATLDEVIDLIVEVRARDSVAVGLYPELKAPAYFSARGFDMGQLLLDQLAARQVTTPVLIQSFDPQVLRQLDAKTDLPLVMLVFPSDPAKPHVPNIPLADIATFAEGVGAMKQMLTKADGGSSGFLEQARSLGLFVHAWTFRDDAVPPLWDSGEAEMRHYFRLGVDGVFTDFPDSGRKAAASLPVTLAQ